MVTQLVAPGVELTFRSDENGWCSVSLSLGGKSVRLGADTRKVVMDRLASALKRELQGKAAGTLHGMKVVWVLSLFEDHAVIYAADAGGQRLLFFREDSGALFGSITLSDEERERWLAQLQAAADGSGGAKSP
jgi:hypothetical protein